MKEKLVVGFEEVGKKDVRLVGGKIASLGEMIQKIKVPVPPGFAVTTHAYNYFLKKNHLNEKIEQSLSKMDTNNIESLKKTGKEIRGIILGGKIPKDLKEEIIKHYRELKEKIKNNRVAVRSSATAEDIESASFAGQQETFLNVSSEQELLKKIKSCFSSLFTNRAIHYREERGFNHLDVALSVGIQLMVDSECSGVAFTIDPDSGFENVVCINGNWGLGTSVVGGKVDADKYYFFKPTKKVISKRMGKKEIKILGKEKIKKTLKEEREKYVLSDSEIEKLGEYCARIENHYKRPMDIEWAKDSITKNLYIVQARPETVHALKKKNIIKEYRIKEKSKILVEGEAVGRKIGQGKVKIMKDIRNISNFKKGEVLITEMTDPDWEPIMKIASAIVTNKGGNTSHAAIVSRELGVPCIVGTQKATEVLKDSLEVTVDCTKETGIVWEGKLPFEVKERNINEIPETKTKIMINLGEPEEAFDLGQYPIDGVGLAREEFIISSHIGEHPLSMIEKKKGKEFVEKLSFGIAKIAAAFYPRTVIVRLSDFKTNEYASLKGGEEFEPKENNPLMGWRGASRYIDNRFKPAFRLECEALKKVRDEMKLTNVKIMIPFCRTINEANKTLKTLEEFGLKRGKNGLEIYVMAEIPSNIILANEFSKFFDGFSIGSNDLTSLTLGIDRDNEKLIKEFDERNKAIKKSISDLIKKAHKNKRKVGICGDAPSTHEEYAEFLVKEGIDSISVTPDVAIETKLRVHRIETKDQ